MEFVFYSAESPIPEQHADQLLQLMQEAFPPEERRADEEFRRLFAHPKVRILCAREKEQFHGFLLFWVLDDFIFVENFAVQPEVRGQGLGAELLLNLKRRYDSPVILEVEPPEDELTRRRVAFYQRNGYHLNECEYALPCLHESIQKSIRLMIMSAPEPLSGKHRKAVIDTLYDTVYQGKPVRT